MTRVHQQTGIQKTNLLCLTLKDMRNADARFGLGVQWVVMAAVAKPTLLCTIVR